MCAFLSRGRFCSQRTAGSTWGHFWLSPLGGGGGGRCATWQLGGLGGETRTAAQHPSRHAMSPSQQPPRIIPSAVSVVPPLRSCVLAERSSLGFPQRQARTRVPGAYLGDVPKKQGQERGEATQEGRAKGYHSGHHHGQLVLDLPGGCGGGLWEMCRTHRPELSHQGGGRGSRGTDTPTPVHPWLRTAPGRH